MKLFDPESPPFLDLERRKDTLSVAEIRGLAPQGSAETVATGVVYLWHDHWREAHEIAQLHEGESAHDFLHGILHRHEKDFGNANYWFRGAGNLGFFPLIASRVAERAGEDPLRAHLLPDGTWNPAAFVELVRNRRTRDNDKLLRAAQAIEMMTFHEWLADKA